MAIEYIQIFGERCTGTNFIQELIIENIPSLKVTWDFGFKLWDFGFKHWFFNDLSKFEEIKDKKDQKDQKNDEQATINNTLFIVVTRNIYDWLRSFFQTSHHIQPKPMLFDQWLTMEIRSYSNSTMIEKPCKNIFELRKQKIENFQLLKHFKLPHLIFVKYEDVKKSPHKFIRTLRSRMEKTQDRQLITNKSFRSVNYYKREKGNIFKPKQYPLFTKEQLDFIEKNTDWEVEKLVGYQIENKDDQVG